MNHSIVVFVVFLSIAVLLACSNEQDIATDAAHKHQTNGWTAYNQKDFSGAQLSFERAIALDSNLADAHNGLGWSQLSVSQAATANSQIIGIAKREFEIAIRIDSTNADAWVGLANTLFLRRALDSDFQTALRAIDNAFDANHRFLFRHDYQSAGNLHLLKAACYYYLGKIDLAKTALETAVRFDSQNLSALSLNRLLK